MDDAIHTPLAAVVTVGSELTEGLRIDTNTATIARSVSGIGFTVIETVSVGDDVRHLAEVLKRLTSRCELVITTGGLGPTHDDITREAAGTALGIAMHTDAAIADWLGEIVSRHTEAASREAVLTQALVLDGALILEPRSGTAPGQIVPTAAGKLILLPGPPNEMTEMLGRALEGYPMSSAAPQDLGVTGVSESDVQHAAQRALEGRAGVTLTVLAKPGDVRVLLIDSGAGREALAAAADAVAMEIGPACYTRSGETLPEATAKALCERSRTLSVAESCTGGLVAAALTDVAGISEVFLGGVVSYANSVKSGLLGVPAEIIALHGAVSEQTAVAMAEGIRALTGSDIAVSTTGIAGPGGATPEKPVGLVWFAVSHSRGTDVLERRYLRGSRESIRARATAQALDLVRRHLLDAD